MRRLCHAACMSLALTSAAWADDRESCFSDLALLRQEPAAVVLACESLAERGDAEAQNQLGVMHAEGWLLPKDNARAVEWYRKAASQGFPPAAVNLAFMHFWGLGVPQDYQQAYVWSSIGAARGDKRGAQLSDSAADRLSPAQLGEAQGRIGDMYDTGGVPIDHAKAAEWYRRAARNFLPAQLSLGRLYGQGLGVPHDDARAFFWFSLAAIAGSREAAKLRDAVLPALTPDQLAEIKNEIGLIYAQGRLAPLVPKNYAKAVQLFFEAAEQGNANAAANLGDMYGGGTGVAQDRVRSYMWYSIAAAAGNDRAALLRDMSAAGMYPEQVAEAEKLAREWKPSIAR